MVSSWPSPFPLLQTPIGSLVSSFGVITQQYADDTKAYLSLTGSQVSTYPPSELGTESLAVSRHFITGFVTMVSLSLSLSLSTAASQTSFLELAND